MVSIQLFCELFNYKWLHNLKIGWKYYFLNQKTTAIWMQLSFKFIWYQFLKLIQLFSTSFKYCAYIQIFISNYINNFIIYLGILVLSEYHKFMTDCFQYLIQYFLKIIILNNFFPLYFYYNPSYLFFLILFFQNLNFPYIKQI